MDKNDKNFKLITAIVIALVVFLVLLVVGTGVLWQNDNSDIPVIDPVLREQEEANKRKEENNNIVNARYSEYKNLYDKYSNDNVTWYIKDCLNSEEDFAKGAFTESVDIYEKDELVIENGEVYWNNVKKGEKVKAYTPKYIDEEMMEEPINNIEFIIVPDLDEKKNHIWLLSEDNTLYCSYNTVLGQYFETWYEFDFFNNSLIDEDSIPKTLNYKIVDMCYIEEKIPEFSDLYFLTEDGLLINEKGEEYVKFTDEFYTLLDSAEEVTQDYITVKYIFFEDRSFIKVIVNENEYNENPKEFWYIGCNGKIKDVYFSINKDRTNYPALIKDIYFLTEDDFIYSYPFSYTYDEKVVRLYRIVKDVKKVDDSGEYFVIKTKDDKAYSGDALLYADGF